jgi:glycerol-3-phosphate dehydrogenase
MDARARGASINPRTACVAAKREGDRWFLTVEKARSGERSLVAARALVNAAGPWVSEVLADVIRVNAPVGTRLVKGSHIVVPRLYDHERAYIFQNADGRVVFAIAFEGEFTLIGTTDSDYAGRPEAVAASADEVDYLCAAASDYFARPVRPADVAWTYSGVRPLYDDGASAAQEATREYVIELDAGAGRSPLLSIFGGKITTYRRLAEHALARLSRHLPMGGPWTAAAPLPGGDFPAGRAAELARSLGRAHPFLERSHAERLVRAYGTRAAAVMHGAQRIGDLGQNFGAQLTEAEVRYLAKGAALDIPGAPGRGAGAGDVSYPCRVHFGGAFHELLL